MFFATGQIYRLKTNEQFVKYEYLHANTNDKVCRPEELILLKRNTLIMFLGSESKKSHQNGKTVYNKVFLYNDIKITDTLDTYNNPELYFELIK